MTMTGMDDAESTMRRAYIARVKEARKLTGRTQQEMATALGISLDRYKKYETRSPLPPYLLPRFAAIVGREVDTIMTGRPSRSRPRNTNT